MGLYEAIVLGKAACVLFAGVIGFGFGVFAVARPGRRLDLLYPEEQRSGFYFGLVFAGVAVCALLV